MLIALFADIHANRQAFEACLARARNQGAQRIVLLGDYVGYGGDPEWTVDTVMGLVEKGAMAVQGNHDSAIGNLHEKLNPRAQIAIEWTRGVLGAPQRQFLASLPLTLKDGDRLYVHAEASRPKSWIYVTSATEAAASFLATRALVTFGGHTHQPALYSVSETSRVTAFTPVEGIAIPLLPKRRWLAVVGAVGQPRDGNPAASYAMLDSHRQELTYFRVPYDVEKAAAEIRKNNLPPWFAQRLLVGQ